MKLSLAELLTPRYRDHHSLGAEVLILQNLLKTAGPFRDKGHWGESGPSEILNGYTGCVNAEQQCWHSSRGRVKTYPEHTKHIRDCILEALCSSQPACDAWRTAHQISLQKSFTFRTPTGATVGDLETRAFTEFIDLEGFNLPHSINPCYNDVNVLCSPELVIGPRKVRLVMGVTSAEELKTSGACASSWSTSSLTETPNPSWDWQHETFTQFLIRGADHFRIAKPYVAKQATANISDDPTADE